MRLAGLGLVVTRDGGIPLTWHGYPGDRPGVTQFAAMTGQLRRQYEAIVTAAAPAGAVAEVVAGYRSQSEAEFSFRQLKDPHVVCFSPMFHWTGHNIRVHMFTCVLALQIARLMRLKARRAGPVRARAAGRARRDRRDHPALPGRARPAPAHRMLTDTTPLQDKLSGVFGLGRYAPRR
ncbi:MAG: hypothetical protein ACRDNT_11650 [Streptosporangiaceae bacterium]